MSVAELFHTEQGIAYTKHRHEYDKWQACSRVFGNCVSHIVPHLLQDATVDLILREWEEEAKQNITQVNDLILSKTHYMTLTRYWILSTYENLRTYCEFMGKKKGHLAKEALDLLDDFGKIRIPLAKLQIQKTNRGVSEEIYTVALPPNPHESPKKYETSVTAYLPVTGIDPQTGSLCWSVIVPNPNRQERISRISLSNAFLDFFGSPQAIAAKSSCSLPRASSS